MNPHLKDIGEDVMGFLNEVQMRYPEAISMASGRPDENYFDLDYFPEYLAFFVEKMATDENRSRSQVLQQLGQYHRAKGIINPAISEYLRKDEQIMADPEDILITVGSQEGMTIATLTLCDKDKDIIIAEDPSYVGMTHLSMLLGYDIRPMPLSSEGFDTGYLEQLIIGQVSSGKRIKIVYVIPDFQNPTGTRMTIRKRERLLELATEHGFFILEDNAYGGFAYDEERLPTIKSMDTDNRVIYLHSFSKVVCPSLRLGAMVAGQRVGGGKGPGRLSDLMAKIKGYLTVNTPAIDQAILGGLLLKNNYSLLGYNKAKLVSMKRKRDALLLALTKYFRGERFCWEKEVSWNTPAGGFFITITLPFVVNKDEVSVCAENHGLIITPMSFFYFNQEATNQIRLAFSNVPDTKIDPAIAKLMQYVRAKIDCSKCNKLCHESKSQY